MSATLESTTAPTKRPRPRIHQTQNFIGGQWVPAQSGKTFDTLDPANEEVIASVPDGDAADVDLAVKAARKQFETATAQTKELTALAQKVATETSEPLKAGMTSAFKKVS